MSKFSYQLIFKLLLSFPYRLRLFTFVSMETIPGYEALARMRAMRHDEASYFILHHITWQEKRQETDGTRVVRRCRLRKSLPSEKFQPDADLFLPYTDLSLPKNDQNRMCRKRCIRYVAFPPEYQLIKVDWFKLKPNGDIQILSE
jgi:hypothetical protein